MGCNIHSHSVDGMNPVLKSMSIFSKNKVLHVSINHIRKRTIQVLFRFQSVQIQSKKFSNSGNLHYQQQKNAHTILMHGRIRNLRFNYFLSMMPFFLRRKKTPAQIPAATATEPTTIPTTAPAGNPPLLGVSGVTGVSPPP